MKLYDLLYKALGQIATLKTNVASALSGNTVYATSGTVAAVYQSGTAVCSLTLPAGTYLILGGVNTDVSVDSVYACLLSGFSNKRTNMSAGGGALNGGIRTLTSTTTIYLSGYSYYSGTYNFTGELYAVKLLTGGVLRKAIDAIFSRMPSERRCFA